MSNNICLQSNYYFNSSALTNNLLPTLDPADLSSHTQVFPDYLPLAQQALAKLPHPRSFSVPHNQWEASIVQLANATYGADFPGESLLAFSCIEDAIRAAIRLENEICHLRPGTVARARAEQDRDRLISFFITTLEDWAEVTLETMRQESTLLLDYLKDDPTEDIVRQLVALQEQIHQLYVSLSQLASRKSKAIQPLRSLIKQITQDIDKEYVRLNKGLQLYQNTNYLPFLEYGSEEWHALVANRPIKTSWWQRLGRAFSPSPINVIDPNQVKLEPKTLEKPKTVDLTHLLQFDPEASLEENFLKYNERLKQVMPGPPVMKKSLSEQQRIDLLQQIESLERQVALFNRINSVLKGSFLCFLVTTPVLLRYYMDRALLALDVPRIPLLAWQPPP